ncbi:MAG: hypothetical protein ACI4KD_05895 [Oscillospiraceae bacterium]
MTDKEITNALECCCTTKGGGCKQCPLNDYGKPDCQLVMATEAYKLINRQKAEIERLSHKCEDCAGCMEWKCDCSHIREEFAERLKQEDFDRCIDVVYDGSGEVKRVEIRRVLFNKQIDNLVKEMTESDGVE